MNIQKPTVKTNFSKIPNEILRSQRLSGIAVAILAWMWSHSETHKVSEAEIIAAFTDGKHTIKRGLKELQEKGWLKITRSRRGAKPNYTLYTSENRTRHTSDFQTCDTSDFQTCDTSDFQTCGLYTKKTKEEENTDTQTPTARPPNMRARAVIYSEKFKDPEEANQSKPTRNKQRAESAGKRKGSAAPLTEEQEAEFYQQAITHKLLGDKNLRVGNATAIVSAALRRLREGTPTPDDKNLLGLYLEGLLGENTRADQTQEKIGQRTAMNALNGL